MRIKLHHLVQWRKIEIQLFSSFHVLLFLLIRDASNTLACMNVPWLWIKRQNITDIKITGDIMLFSWYNYSNLSTIYARSSVLFVSYIKPCAASTGLGMSSKNIARYLNVLLGPQKAKISQNYLYYQYFSPQCFFLFLWVKVLENNMFSLSVRNILK